MLSGFDGFAGDMGMVMIRSGNDHCVNIFIVQQILIAFVSFGREVLSGITSGTNLIGRRGESPFSMQVKYITYPGNRNIQILLFKPFSQ